MDNLVCNSASVKYEDTFLFIWFVSMLPVSINIPVKTVAKRVVFSTRQGHRYNN